MRWRCACLLVLLVTATAAAEPVTLADLLRQMGDLSRLTEFPDPPYVTKQFSSYERLSETPGNDNWWANHDRGFMLYSGVLKDRTPFFKHVGKDGKLSGEPLGEFAAGTKVGIALNRPAPGNNVWAYATAPDGTPKNGKTPQGFIPRDAITFDSQGHVMAEMDGPGCVVNVWSANPQDAGWIRIYLDHGEKPVIEGKMADVLGGTWKIEQNGKSWVPFPPPLSCETARGYNLYFPIAYQKHCKITVEKPDIYYHVDYRVYPRDTKVETFSLGAYAKFMEGKTLWDFIELRPVVVKGSPPLTAGPGVKTALLDRQGAGVIVMLSLHIKDADKLTAADWRGLVLVGTFDGADRPQIWCPVADFFGSGPSAAPYKSLPAIVEKQGNLTSNWAMPFAKSAKLELLNLNKQPVELTTEIKINKHVWTQRSMHFHARWRTATMKTRPFRDFTYSEMKGKGVYVGNSLNLFNPVPAWWGEGDERIYVDGEAFPSWFGTGTEDYYGYAWKR